MRFATLFVALAVLPFATTACTSEAASAAGTYSVEAQVDTAGMPEEQANMIKEMMKPGEAKLNADMTFEVTMEMRGQKSTVKGTWKLDGGTVTMTSTEVNGEKNEEIKTGTYKDGTITIKDDSGPQPMTMILKKK